jgi:hypothetical protein
VIDQTGDLGSTSGAPRAPVDVPAAAGHSGSDRSASEESPERDDAPAKYGGLRRLSSRGVTAVTALVALVASAVALAFDLWPGLKPDPRENFRADVGVFSVDRGVTLDDYLRRTTFSRADYRQARAKHLSAAGVPEGDPSTRGLLTLAGEVVYVASTLQGFKRRSVTLRWSLYDARTRTRLNGPSFSGVSAAQVEVEAPTDRTLQEIWLPPPPGRGPYFVRVALYDDRDVLLAVADSEPFVGR